MEYYYLITPDEYYLLKGSSDYFSREELFKLNSLFNITRFGNFSYDTINMYTVSYISTSFHSSYQSLSMNIYKSIDEWYVVQESITSLMDGKTTYYKCDQFDGLIRYLDILMERGFLPDTLTGINPSTEKLFFIYMIYLYSEKDVILKEWVSYYYNVNKGTIDMYRLESISECQFYLKHTIDYYLGSVDKDIIEFIDSYMYKCNQVYHFVDFKNLSELRKVVIRERSINSILYGY